MCPIMLPACSRISSPNTPSISPKYFPTSWRPARTPVCQSYRTGSAKEPPVSSNPAPSNPVSGTALQASKRVTATSGARAVRQTAPLLCAASSLMRARSDSIPVSSAPCIAT